MIKIIFFISVGLLIYNYFFYPLIVIYLSKIQTATLTAKAANNDNRVPLSITLIIAAYNEERVIDAKIRNSLELDYPKDRFQLLVVSDGSTDATPDIARRYTQQGVLSLHEPQRRGKTAALNRAVAASTTDIVVFSDANNFFEKNAIREMVKHFADPRVGGVCGLKQIYDTPDRESSQGDSLYWRYESAIKEAESNLGSITTADGEIFAVRRSLYQPINESVINDDAEITLNLVREGYRVLYERSALSYEHASIRIEDDFHVKVRMVSGGFQTLARHWRLLLPPRSWFAVAFFSHKVLRWFAPELLILTMVCSIWLIDQPFFLVMTVLQVCFYLLAIIGWLTRNRRFRSIVLYVPFYFCAMNLAALRGFWRFLTGSQSTQWRKAER